MTKLFLKVLIVCLHQVHHHVQFFLLLIPMQLFRLILITYLGQFVDLLHIVILATLHNFVSFTLAHQRLLKVQILFCQSIVLCVNFLHAFAHQVDNITNGQLFAFFAD